MTSLSSPLPTFAYSIAMIVAVLLAIGGVYLVARRRDVKRGVLMLLVAAVIVANVVIWTLPLPVA